MQPDDDSPVSTNELSALLKSDGTPVASATLTKLRCVGGGPEYLKFGRMVRYRPSKGRAWVAQRTRELRNTSEVSLTQGRAAVTKVSASPAMPGSAKLPQQENCK